MKIYYYHPETKIYLNEGVADENPVNPANPIIPNSATTIKPPAVGENQAAFFDEGAWEIRDISQSESEPEPEPEIEPELTPEELKTIAITSLNAEYEPQFSELQKYYIAALMDGDSQTQQDILDERVYLIEEFQGKLAAILNS